MVDLAPDDFRREDSEDLSFSLWRRSLMVRKRFVFHVPVKDRQPLRLIIVLPKSYAVCRTDSRSFSALYFNMVLLILQAAGERIEIAPNGEASIVLGI